MNQIRNSVFSLLILFIGLSSCEKEDKEAPEILLNGGATVTVGINTAYTELGATATDNEDGILAPLISGDLVNTNIAKTYRIIYSVSDKKGNSSTIYRYVVVKNEIEDLAGLYHARKLGYDTSGAIILDSLFDQTIVSSTTINNRFSIVKFANITFAPTSTKINFDVSGGGTLLTLPQQSGLAKENGTYKTHYYRGFGTLSGDTLLELTYFDSLANAASKKFTLKLTHS